MSKLTIATEDRVTETSSRPYTLMRVEGFIDAPNYARFEAALEKVVKDKTNVVLDFGRVEYINSTGISAVIRFHGTLSQKSGALILVQVSRNVGLTMHLLGVTTLVPFLKTLDEAESAIDAQAVEVTDDVAQSTFESLDKGSSGPASAPVFVESASGDAPPGTVIMAMPSEGPFEKIFHQRIQKLRGDHGRPRGPPCGSAQRGRGADLLEAQRVQDRRSRLRGPRRGDSPGR